jgi:hypothetical protein
MIECVKMAVFNKHFVSLVETNLIKWDNKNSYPLARL